MGVVKRDRERPTCAVVPTKAGTQVFNPPCTQPLTPLLARTFRPFCLKHRTNRRLSSLNHTPTGFTLVELLVVVVIVGIVLSLAVGNLFTSSEERVRIEASRLATLIEKTRDQAAFSGYPIAMRLAESGVEFLERDPSQVALTWRTATTDSLKPRQWRDGIRAEFVSPEGTSTPDRVATFLPAGVGTPFTVRVFDAQFERRIEGDALGNVKLK